MRKRIALITTWFPPSQGVAVQRMHAFAQYLSAYYEIEVFTLLDNTLTKHIEDKFITVHRYSEPFLFRILKHKTTDITFLHHLKTLCKITLGYIFPDPLNNWKKKVSIALNDMHHQNPFNVILSSFSPVQPHEIAITFKQSHTSVKWIADMRDEMSLNTNLTYKQKHKLSDIEKQVNAFADAIISVSDPLVNEFKIQCPDVKTFFAVKNGFNHNLKFDPVKKSNITKLTWGYFGTFYGLRKPDIFFSALEKVIKTISVPIEGHLFGVHHNFTIPESLKSSIFIHSTLSYIDTVKKMNEMDFNLLIHPSTERKGIFTGKLFDYISVQRPILAIVDVNDVAAELISNYECGYIADFNAPHEIAFQLQCVIGDLMRGHFKVASTKNIALLHRKVQIEKIKAYIESTAT